MPHYLLVTTEGTVNVHDFDRLLTTVTRSPEWVAGTAQLVDHRDLDPAGLDSSGIKKIEQVVEKYRDNLGNGPCAFVVKDEVGFGFARMYEMIGGDTIHKDVEVFYSIEEAGDWLNKKSLADQIR
jgi:hypothetical protein